MNVINAKIFAINLHKERNLFYDGNPYEIHLRMVFGKAKEYLHLLDEEYHDNVLSAAWMHDTLEDCAITYNDIRDAGFSDRVADIVYDVTNELGKNRKERAERTYPKIAKNKLAVYVKVCDRIANMKYSASKGSCMSDKYRGELNHFIDVLNVYPELEPMFDELKTYTE